MENEKKVLTYTTIDIEKELLGVDKIYMPIQDFGIIKSGDKIKTEDSENAAGFLFLPIYKTIEDLQLDFPEHILEYSK